MNPTNDPGENKNPEKPYPIRSARYMRCRDRLLAQGFTEAACRVGNFFLPATEKTAFVVNLYDEESGVTVLYGFASTAYTAGDAAFFANFGADDTSCQLRNILYLWDDNSALLAEKTISGFYFRYKDSPKDEILKLKNERQKVFLDHFSQALKPLGFHKKRSRWTKALHDGMALTFEAQKSAFSDQYYFNVVVHKASDFYASQSNRRVVINHSDIYNWQLMTEAQISNLIRYALAEYILPEIQRSSKTGL